MDPRETVNFRFDTDRTFEEFSSDSLMNEYSPSIPFDFPKSKIPKNKCEIELLKLARCTMFLTSDFCGKEYSDFLICKKDRDIYTFNEIKNWESDKFRNKNLQERAEYLKELTEKLKNVEKSFHMIPFLNLYKQKKNRFQSDIEQLNWRINYLKKIS